MPAQGHPSFTDPADTGVPIWRYMDFTKLVSMLENEGLYLSRADLLGDPFEGSIPKATNTWFTDVHKSMGISDKKITDLKKKDTSHRQATAHAVYVNCWHMNDRESAAMWRLYAKSNEAIAVRSTYQKLCSLLPDEPTMYCTRVRYIDYGVDFIDPGNMFNPFVHKRRSFEHEREVRVVCAKLVSTIDGTWGNNPSGLWARVKLGELVDELLIAPDAPEWLHTLVEQVVHRYDFSFPVKQSSLAKSPIF